MANAQRADLAVWRKDPLRLIIHVVGYDLTNSAPSLAVKLYPDAPGSPLLLLSPQTTAGQPGLRVVSVTTDDDGVTTTLLEGLQTKAAVAALPSSPEPGCDAIFWFDLQWTPPDDGLGLTSVEETVMFGRFIVKGSVND